MKTIQTADTLYNYSNATPELLREMEGKRDATRAEYERLAVICADLKAALGIGDPSFLTYTDEGTAAFFDLCESDSTFCNLYASDPAAGEKVLREKMLRGGKDEDQEC